MPLLSTHCKWLSEQIGYTERMNKEWVRFALTSTGLFHGLLLIASRHLSMVHDYDQEKRRSFAQQAMHYKITCIQNLNMSITAEQSSKFNDSTLALVIILAQDEVGLASRPENVLAESFYTTF
jgi:hypothetical protein